MTLCRSAVFACSVLLVVFMPGSGWLGGSTLALAQDGISARPAAEDSGFSVDSGHLGDSEDSGSLDDEETAVGSLRVTVRAVPPFAFHQDGGFHRVRD